MLRLLNLLIVSLTYAIASRVEARTTVHFRTSVGDMLVELYDEDKPVTVQNFLRYVNEGRYTNMFYHRWDPDFVVQGGGFRVTNRGTVSPQIQAVSTFPQIPNEYATNRVYSNTYGTIAMARIGGQPNSASSQWFFNLGNNLFLDTAEGGYTVFGRVVIGLDVLQKFQGESGTKGIYVFNGGGVFNELPVLKPQFSYDDLIYVDISVFKLNISYLPAGRELKWQGVAGKTNALEYTNEFPPTWKTFFTTNPPAGQITVRDATARTPIRFYRLRVND